MAFHALRDVSEPVFCDYILWGVRLAVQSHQMKQCIQVNHFPAIKAWYIGSEGIHKVLIVAHIAIISFMQRYIKPRH